MRTVKRSFRCVIVCLLALGGLAASIQQSAADTHGAIAFLSGLQDQTVLQLADPEIAQEERAERFHKLFERHFDVPTIGRFVVGRYWRAAATSDRDAFLAVFQEAMQQRFLPVLAEAHSTQLRLGTSRRDSKKPAIVRVTSNVTRGSEAFKVVWVLRETDGDYRILDVVTEGVSMVITLRSEYGSVIKASGGRLAGLTEKLRRIVARGAIAPNEPEAGRDSAQAE